MSGVVDSTCNIPQGGCASGIVGTAHETTPTTESLAASTGETTMLLQSRNKAELTVNLEDDI